MERDKQTVYFTYYGHPDRHDRQSFLMEWWHENHHTGPSWRGQMFKDDPFTYLKIARHAGKQIVEIHKEPLR